MPNLILDLMVDRVDLVDEGANSAAHIKLYKRKENQSTMTFEEIIAKMKPEHAAVIEEELAKAKAMDPDNDGDDDNNPGGDNDDDAKEELAKAKSDLADLQAKYDEVVKSKEQKEEPKFEDVLKSLDPSVQEVFKSLKAQKDAAEEVARQAAEKAANDEAIAKARELKALPVEEAKLVEVMKGITPEVMDILKAANQAMVDGGLFDEVGKSKDVVLSNSGDSSDAWAKIEKAAEIISAEEQVSKAKAISKAIKQNPELYSEYLKGGAN